MINISWQFRKLQSAAGSRPYTSIPRVQRQYPMYSYTVKVYHISMSVSVQRLESIFKRYGSCRVTLRHPRMGEDQHAYVTYTALEEAQKAARGTDGAILHGERITAKVEGNSGPELTDHTIKVENLARRTSEEMLEETFGFHEDAEILGITIKTPAIGPSYAYIYYSNGQDAQKAVSELDGKTVDESTVQVKLHTLKEKLEVDCEPLIVRIITSPDRPEYRSQIQSIEHSNLVTIQPAKNEQGFVLKGNVETLEEVKAHLELVIAKLQERLEDEQFTLPSSCASSFSDQETSKQILKIERKYQVQFYICNAQESVKMSECFQHTSMIQKPKAAAAASHGDSAMAECTPDCATSREEIQTQLNLKARGLKENLAQGIVALKTISH